MILDGIVPHKQKKTEAALLLLDKLQTGMPRQFWRNGGRIW